MTFVTSERCGTRGGNPQRKEEKKPRKGSLVQSDTSKITHKWVEGMSSSDKALYPEFVDFARSKLTDIWNKVYKGGDLEKMVSKYLQTLTEDHFLEWKLEVWFPQNNPS